MFSVETSLLLAATRRTLRAGCVILTTSFLGATLAFSQDLDMDCRPIVSIPPQCRQIARDLAARENSYRSRIEVLQDRLKEAPPSQRQSLRQQIKALQQQRDHDSQIAQLKAQLDSCRAQFDHTPRRPVAASELDAGFTGTATVVTTNPNVNPTPVDLNLGIRFSKNRCVVTITSFPKISFVVKTPIEDITVSITMRDGGTGQVFPVTGELVMPISLHFDYDTILASNDDASMTLTTESSTSPKGAFHLNGTRLTTSNGTTLFGPVTLVGATTFQNGYLSGTEGGFTISGQTGPPLPPSSSPQPLCPRDGKCCEKSDDGRRCRICVPKNGRCP